MVLTKDLVTCLADQWKNGIRDGRDRAYLILLRSLLDQGPIVFRFNLDAVKTEENEPAQSATKESDTACLTYCIYDMAVRLGHSWYRQALEQTFGPRHSEYFNARFFLDVEHNFAEMDTSHAFEKALEEACEQFSITLQSREVAA